MASPRTSEEEKELEAFYWGMEQTFGQLDNPVPKKKTDDKKEAAGVKRKMTEEEKRGEAKLKKGSAAAAATGGVEATEKEEVPVVQRSLETPNIVSPAETLAPTPTPEATVSLVPRLSLDSALQQTFSKGCIIRREASTTAGPSHQVLYTGPVTVYMGKSRKPEEEQNLTAEPELFTILNVKVEQHEVTFIEAIVRLLGLVDVQISPADVKLIGVAHGMPPANCKRFHTNFQLPADHSAAVTAVLESRQITETVNGQTIEIVKKVSYLEILERELLKLGQKVFSKRLAPTVVCIEGNRVVYTPFEIPTKTISLSVPDMLKDDVFRAEVENTFNRVARKAIHRIQE